MPEYISIEKKAEYFWDALHFAAGQNDLITVFHYAYLLAEIHAINGASTIIRNRSRESVIEA